MQVRNPARRDEDARGTTLDFDKELPCGAMVQYFAASQPAAVDGKRPMG